MCWGFSSTISKDDFYAVNGQDEIYDGCICGTDMDLGNRINQISKINRIASRNYVYEINDYPYKYMIRDDVKAREIYGQSPFPKYIKANSWKPSQEQLHRYKQWHESKLGQLDSNWDRFMDVPMLNLKDMRSELIYAKVRSTPNN